ncbi:addiction module antidote protein [Taklimakanibacter deserti]|uniref:addiction module antidote protein n=1 Tax=Taklimakanibacter deserti TaxID=2267839 RepID=UPI000E65D654
MKTRKIETAAWDSAEVLDTPEAIEEYLAAAFETDDPVFIAKALGVVARARNMSELARDVGMTRAALYRAFNGETSPEFATIMKIMHALGVGIAPVMRRTGKAA